MHFYLSCYFFDKCNHNSVSMLYSCYKKCVFSIFIILENKLKAFCSVNLCLFKNLTTSITFVLCCVKIFFLSYKLKLFRLPLIYVVKNGIVGLKLAFNKHLNGGATHYRQYIN